MIVDTPIQGIVANTEKLSLKVIVSDSEISYAVYDELNLLFSRTYKCEANESIRTLSMALLKEDEYWNSSYRNVSVAYDSGQFETFPATRKIDLEQLENLRMNYTILDHQDLGIDRNALVAKLVVYPYSKTLSALKSRCRLQHLSSCFLRFLSIYGIGESILLCHKHDAQLTLILKNSSDWDVQSLWYVKKEELSYFLKSAITKMPDAKLHLSGSWTQEETEYINRTFSENLADFIVRLKPLSADEMPFMALNLCG